MINIILSEFEIEMLDQYVYLYMDTFSKDPWNESWESRGVVEKLFKNHYANNYFLGFIAKQNNYIVGISLGFTKPWIKGMEYYIDEFFVAYNYQNKGVGKSFMEAIQKQLISMNINDIFLMTKQNSPAQTFYKNSGFKLHDDIIVLSKSF